jgi:two-component system response regulator FlrC
MKVIAVVDDESSVRNALKMMLVASGYSVEVFPSAESFLTTIFGEGETGNTFDLIISDERMGGMSGLELLSELRRKDITVPFVVITAFGTVHTAVDAMKRGATDFLLKPFTKEAVFEVLERALSSKEEEHKRIIKRDVGRPLITRNRVMKRILEVAEGVARSDATVLLQGESGTGKELVSRLIHQSSDRRDQPFVAVNCAALPSHLLESELFGHEKGAFTGAQVKKLGKFELAHGGTILLDEISEMDLALQAKLLRVLQEREVDRVGGAQPVAIDVRVIATTNRNLEQMVRDNLFRADLYYRLNVIPLTLLPLRERRDDIEPLLEFFMRKYLGERAPIISSTVLEALFNYNWPGNIRELQNAVERAAILCSGHEPRCEHFFLGAGMVGEPIASDESGRERLSDQIQVERTHLLGGDNLRIESGMTVHEVEKNLIMETLRSTGHNRTKAADLLGISVRTLRNKLQLYGED